jgi:hypothetical protein
MADQPTLSNPNLRPDARTASVRGYDCPVHGPGQSAQWYQGHDGDSYYCRRCQKEGRKKRGRPSAGATAVLAAAIGRIEEKLDAALPPSHDIDVDPEARWQTARDLVAAWHKAQGTQDELVAAIAAALEVEK